MKHFFCIIAFLFFLSSSTFASQINDSLILNGYGNFSTYSSSRKDPNERELDLSLGFQGRYKLTQNLNATAQIDLSSKRTTSSIKNYDFEKKWLYLDYYLGNDYTVRAGLFQLPIFESLETGNIGYAKTWTREPLNVYGAHGYDSFTGLELLKKYFYKEKEFLFQLSYGASDTDLDAHNRNRYIHTDTNNLLGVTIKLIEDNYKLSFGYVNADSKLNQIDTILETTRSRGKTNFDMFAFEGQYNIDDFTLRAGVIDGKVSRHLPDEFRYYTSMEYNIDQFTPYIYYSNEKLTNKIISSSSTPPPPLLQAKDTIIKRVSLGVRYDINSNMALKLSYTHEKQNEHKFNTINKTTISNKNNFNTYMLVLNVVF